MVISRAEGAPEGNAERLPAMSALGQNRLLAAIWNLVCFEAESGPQRQERPLTA